MKHILQLFSIFIVFSGNSQTTLEVECYQDISNNFDNQITIDGNLIEYGLCGTTPSFYVSVIDTNCTAWGTKYSATNSNMNNDFGNYNNDGNCRSRVEYYFVYRQNDSLDLVYMDSLLNYWIPNGHTVAIWTPIDYNYASINSIHAPLATTLYNKWGGNVQTIPMIVLFGIEGDPSSFTADGLTTGSNISISKTICSETNVGITELLQSQRELVRVLDFMGRETEVKPNTPLIFIYSDGTRERVMKIEE